jgi:hypothetical protein
VGDNTRSGDRNFDRFGDVLGTRRGLTLHAQLTRDVQKLEAAAAKAAADVTECRHQLAVWRNEAMAELADAEAEHETALGLVRSSYAASAAYRGNDEIQRHALDLTCREDRAAFDEANARLADAEEAMDAFDETDVLEAD